MDADIYLCSSSEEDSDYDVELSSSSDEAEDDDDPDRAVADARQWSKIDTNSVPPAPPRETNRYAEQKLNASKLSEHSRLKKWVPTTTKEMQVFLSLLLLRGIVQKPEQEWYWSKNKLLHTP
ncbi:hypothetical protein HPB47_014652 [Ixodes persulcatus]|uniref:Uncharacterized protein n=1 Tax=Ixodes persulcatus TaxID=34615 RepID=A0AC60QWU2_IXOPE|nr:hypothetical protein HPB47_014652 [Ixodes persulcatus]